MSLLSTDKEVFDVVKKRENDKTHIIYDEELKRWFCTLCNPEYVGILDMEFGYQFLLDYFLWLQKFTIESNFDTIHITKQERSVGFIRYLKHAHVIETEPNLTERLLYKLLLLFQKRSEYVRVTHNPNSIQGSLITFSGNEKDLSFVVESKESQTERMRYLIEHYTKKNPNAVVREDEEGYYFAGISFSKEGLTEAQRNLFTKKNEYVSGPEASFLRKLYEQVQVEGRYLQRRL